MLRRAVVAFLVLTSFLSSNLLGQSTGRIAGRVSGADNRGIGGVVVTVDGLSTAALTDANGNYAIDRVPAGSYTVRFAAGDDSASESVTVTSGSTARLDRVVDWQISLAESITVYSASRRTERVVEAPAAVTIVPEAVLETQSATGQLPKVIEGAPGVDFTQSGLYDFNFNTRGFNSSLNRRILTLIDGRDPAVPFLGAQEWAALSFPIDEMANVELVRGPGSALYGANAFSGVLNMVTKQPRSTPGGKLALIGGDLNTRRADVRHAGGFGGDWFYRVVGGYQQSDDFAVSRNRAPEYGVACSSTLNRNCLPREAIPLALTEDEIMYGGVRLDKHFAGGELFTIDAGWSAVEGPIFQTGIGRVQVTDSQHPWLRLNYNMPHWNFLAYYDARVAEDQKALASGASLWEDSSNIHGEIQTNWDLGTRARVVGGVAYNQQKVDTSNPSGFHTLMAEAKEEHQSAVFGQLEFEFTEKLRAVVAGRYDDSSLHDAEVSPKAALVYSFTPSQNVRLTYNRAFQVPNYSEFFLRVPAAAPVNLSAIENAFRPALGGVSLGFSAIPVLALGNSALEVEKIETAEIGYSGIFGGKVFVTADYYESQIEDFVTDLLPAVNPAYPRYQVPAGVNPAVAAQILGALQRNLPPTLFPALTNINGTPAFVLSYTNAGKVDTRGVDLGMNYYLTNAWLLDASYSWFDFEVEQQQLGDELLPNAPEHKASVGLAYRTQKWGASAAYRWVDDFYWAAGVFKGPVESYSIVNLGANYNITDNIEIGTTISNALDEEAWQTWGGDLVGRRALAYLNFLW